MTTALDDLRLMLLCEDVPESIRFYTDVLGFTVVDRMDDVGKSGWANLRNDRIQLMLASPHAAPEGVKVDGRYPQAIYYFYPRDVVALHAAVKAAGHEPSDLCVRFYGMKEFDVVDPSGHQLVFGQPTNEPPDPSPNVIDEEAG